jgi:Na+/phosphate symporter
MIVYLSVLVALIGVLMYALCANPKLQELGRIAFFCGLLTFLLNGQRLIEIIGNK